MRKILIVSTVSRQFYLFEKGNIEVLKSLGYEVHAAANFSDSNERLDTLDIIRHPFDIERSPFSFKNIRAYKQLKHLMKTEKFDVVHCHSPMGGVLARIAARSVGIPKVIYTAHGFHFYKGAPIFNWLVYYTIEKFLSRYTNVLITINNEDYKRSKKFNADRTEYVPGIGVGTKKIMNLKNYREKKREKLGISKNTVVLLSVGEMIKRKNHETVIKALSELNGENIKYLICGRGELESHLKKLTMKLGIMDKVEFLGYRNDIPEICAASDIFIFPSFQEGLPVSLMEAMSASLPIIGTNIRGTKDLVKEGVGGYLLSPNEYIQFADKISRLIQNPDQRKKMGKINLENVQRYDEEIVKQKMCNIYNSLDGRY